ncbi:MAG TPA: hypothetical protein VFW24_09030, partial [Acidimicrobiales bacterium]|nr:hypothetical protein [Acidimicrobiales bacterium]
RDIAKVDQHLADCRACSARRAELEDVGTTLRRVAAPLPLALGPLAWRHWLTSLRAATKTRKPLIPVQAQRTLTGASFGLLGLGIIGASIIGQPSLGSTTRPRPAGAVPVGQSPVAVEEAKAATQTPPGPLALLPSPLLALGGGSAAGPVASGSGSAANPAPAAPAPTAATGTNPDSGAGPLQPIVPQGSGPVLQLSAQINLTKSTSATVNAGTGSTGTSVAGVPPTDTTPAPSGSVSVTTPITSNTVTLPGVSIP